MYDSFTAAAKNVAFIVQGISAMMTSLQGMFLAKMIFLMLSTVTNIALLKTCKPTSYLYSVMVYDIGNTGHVQTRKGKKYEGSTNFLGIEMDKSQWKNSLKKLVTSLQNDFICEDKH